MTHRYAHRRPAEIVANTVLHVLKGQRAAFYASLQINDVIAVTGFQGLRCNLSLLHVRDIGFELAVFHTYAAGDGSTPGTQHPVGVSDYQAIGDELRAAG